MKSIIILFATASVYITGCTQHNMSDMFSNDSHRSEMFSEILQNDQWSSELIDSLMMKHHGQMMMKMKSAMMGDKSMQEDMMGKMMDNCDTDSSMCTMMTVMMTNHKPSMKMMMGIMHDKGMIDMGCMQRTLKSIEEPVDMANHLSHNK